MSIRIESVNDPAFRRYGRVITDVDVTALTEAARAIPRPKTGSTYTATEPSFERLPVAQVFRDRLFGQLPIQVGYCQGHANRMNALEWHKSSEVNVAITPLVLILGRVQDIDDTGRLDAATVHAFRAEAGTVLEVYSTSLHYCPCEVSSDGFGCVVVLPIGTNTPLDADAAAEPLLFRRNKWIIAHEDQSELIARGVQPGIYGENYEIPTRD